MEKYGAWGPNALKAFSQVASQLAIHGNTPKSKVVAELYGRLSLLLISINLGPLLPPINPTGQLSVCVLCVSYIMIIAIELF